MFDRRCALLSSVSIPEGLAKQILADALGREPDLAVVPPHFDAALGATAGVRFLYDAAGNYLEDANAWQLKMSTRTSSKHTRSTRSSALKAILKWYEANDLRWQDCTELAHVNLMRLHFRGVSKERPAPLVKKSTWNQWMDHWHAFLRDAEETGRIGGVSFDLREAKQPGKAESSIRALRPDEFARFAAAIDSQRMRAGAYSCIGTGIRLAELAALRRPDVPLPAEYGGESYRPREITGKGDKTRTIYWPLAAAKAIYAYLNGERALAVDALIARVRSGALALEKTFLVEGVDAKTGRKALVEGPDAPLWLAESGEPLSYTRWSKEFAKVSKVSGIHASAHWLRHSYAIITLSMLIKQQIRQSIIETRIGSADRSVYFRDPVDEVRRRLGHASIKTTMIYLDHIAEHRHLVALALADLERMYMND